MLPPVSEVVLVEQGVLCRKSQIRQANLAIVEDFFHVPLGIRYPVPFSLQEKLMQMAIGPSHDLLDDVVKSGEGEKPVRHHETSPDGGTDPLQDDLELDAPEGGTSGGFFDRMSGGTLSLLFPNAVLEHNPFQNLSQPLGPF